MPDYNNDDIDMITQKVLKRRPILILGGTSEAYQLAEILHDKQINCVTSLAGRTSSPRLPMGKWRIGGFGGVSGLMTYLLTAKINLIIDATHPFARQITDNARQAARITKIPLIRLERPLWKQQKGDIWTNTKNIDEALTIIPKDKNILLALGRKQLARFANRKEAIFFARMINYPDNQDAFKNIEFIISPPTDCASEKELFLSKNIDCIVCRNSGGSVSYGKIEAARELCIPVIMIERTAVSNIMTVHSVDDILNYLAAAEG